MSVEAFLSISKSDKPYLCPHCLLECQATEISELKNEIAALKSAISELTKQAQLQPASGSASVSDAENVSISYAATLKLNTESPHTAKVDPPRSSFQLVAKDAVDRKYNIVIYGIEESPDGTSRQNRLSNDTKEVHDIVKVVDDSIPIHSIRDCVRLHGEVHQNETLSHIG